VAGLPFTNAAISLASFPKSLINRSNFLAGDVTLFAAWQINLNQTAQLS
jgi:hypothetical protein